MKIFDFFKNQWLESNFWAYVVTTNGFALNNDKSLQIYFFCVRKHQANNGFLKDVESTVG